MLVLCCTEICELAFPGCTVSWNKEFVNLHLLSSGNMMGASAKRSWLFTPPAWNLGTSSALNIPHIINVFESSEDSRGCRSGLLLWSWDVPPTSGDELRLNLPGYTLNLFFASSSGRRKTVHIFVMTYVEGICSTLSNEGKCKNIWWPKYIFYKCNTYQLFVNLQQRQYELWPMFYNHRIGTHAMMGLTWEALKKCYFKGVLFPSPWRCCQFQYISNQCLGEMNCTTFSFSDYIIFCIRLGGLPYCLCLRERATIFEISLQAFGYWQ